jgi:hypothetical protein
MQVELEIAGRKLVFSALNLGQLRALEQTMSEVQAGSFDNFQVVFAFLPHIHASLVKAQPEITQEQLETAMTLEDIEPAQRAMLQASGLKVAEKGETLPVAESTGPISTVASSPQPDGNGSTLTA